MKPRRRVTLPRSTPVALAAVSLALLAACASRQVGEIGAGDRPEDSSVEAGLWLQMDKAEQRIRTSGQRVTDTALEDYVREVACRVAGPYCEDLRVYVMDVPEFNASMAPNGVMVVWTGLLLRMENEAQLATVLGHEIAHYQLRHSLKRWYEIRDTVNVMSVLQIGTIMAGLGAFNDLGALAAQGYLAAFSRGAESEADDRGIRLLAGAGYAPDPAAEIWQGLLDEIEASDEPRPPAFFASHPAPADRADTLRQLANFLAEPGQTERLGRDDYLAATLPHRARWLRAELDQRRFERTQVLLDRLIEDGAGLGTLHFAQGELYRIRGQDGDEAKAAEAYRRATAQADAPAAAWRSLGLVLRSQDRPRQAAEAFQAYLLAEPQAADRAMIESYLGDLP